MSGALLEVNNLQFSWSTCGKEKSLLKGLCFTVSQGEIVAVLGRSGCGKTTLLRLLTGYLAPLAGTVLMNGAPPSEYKSRIGVLFQDNRLVPWMTVTQNIELPTRVHGAPSLEAKAIDTLLRKLRLKGHEQKYPSELSGGLTERAALARTLLFNPDILILDEPFDSVDYIHQLQLEDFIFDYVHEEHRCCVIVTHDLDMAASIADRVVIIGLDTASGFVTFPNRQGISRDTPPSVARGRVESATSIQRLIGLFGKDK